MRSAIVLAGDVDIEQLGAIIKNSNYTIASDGGANYLYEISALPDIVIGDMDSITQKARDFFSRHSVRFDIYPTDKDFTDGELALENAIKAGARKVVLIGAIGDRIDHSIANIYLLKRLVDLNIEAKIITKKQEILLIKGKRLLKARIGETISILPFYDNASNVVLDGFKYILNGASMEFSHPYGVSNIALQSIVSISSDGYLLVIKELDINNLWNIFSGDIDGKDGKEA